MSSLCIMTQSLVCKLVTSNTFVKLLTMAIKITQSFMCSIVSCNIGLRSAMVDFQEIRGSQGTSSVLMEGKGHRVYFTVEEVPGYIEIKRSGWTGFEYSCIMRDRKIPESTEKPPKGPELFYKLQITGTLLTPDELSEYPVTWYIVKATRMEDNVTTSVHR